MKKLFLNTASLCALLGLGQAATVDVSKNSVTAGGRTVRSGSTVPGGASIDTGAKSKLQLSLEGGGIVRAGSGTSAELAGNESSVSLKKGLILASTGSAALGRQSLKVETPEASASVKGTMQVAYQPKTYMKVTCLEGSVSIKLRAVMGEFVALKAGQMVIINPADKGLPEPVDVDLNELAQTSALLAGEFPPLSTSGRINTAIARQIDRVAGGELATTNLLLRGSSSELTVDRGIEGQRVEDAPEPPPIAEIIRKKREEEKRPGGIGGYIIDETTVFDANTLTTPGLPTVVGSGDGYSSGTIYRFPNAVGRPSLLIRNTVDIPATPGSSSDTYSAVGLMQIGDGNPASVTFLSDFVSLYASEIRINHAGISAGSLSLDALPAEADHSGAHGPIAIHQSDILADGFFSAYGGVIAIGDSVIHANNVGLNGENIIDINNSVVETDAGGGNISLHSMNADGSKLGIVVQNSSQLKALSSLGSLNLMTDGSSILVANSNLSAGGTISIDTMGSAAVGDSLINLTNVTANASVIQARAFNSLDRDALFINGGSYTASNLIKFYAEGASKLRFAGNVNLNSPNITLAGKTVQVDSGGVVNGNGIVNVYSDQHNYNSSGFTAPGFGTINGSVLRQSHSSRPTY